jgi:undecaprenyl diphosphate synthase
VAHPPLARPTDAPPAAHAGDDVALELPTAVAVDVPDRIVPPDESPRHVAIIMDGNRRWARAHGLAELEGHAAGLEAVRAVLKQAVRRGVPMLTLYAFSRENWARTDEEVAGLFALLGAAIRDETEELGRQGVRVRLLGRLDELPEPTRRSIGDAIEATEAGDRLLLNIAFNYAGRTEIVDAVRTLIAAGTSPEDVDEAAVSNALYTAGLPDPDLVIRTGGEERLSNFLIWQSAYAEFYFSPLLWPDFGSEAFDEAILEFASRTRRFGR